jgi:excisionase family DNA binding protein
VKPLVPIADKLGLARAEAAEYIGIGVDKFDEMVKDGRMPKPKLVDSKKLWMRSKIEKAFAELPEEGQTPKKPNPWRDLSLA